MAFGDYKTLGEAIRALQVTETFEEFVQPVPLAVSEYFRERLKTRLTLNPMTCSEWAVCENVLFPILDEAILPHSDALVIWSHASMSHEGKLLGSPDYIIAKRSPLSKDVFDTPLAMIMEAKKNDFDMGWGQCLAAMHAAQTINGSLHRVIYGGVSDGWTWRFGKLSEQTLTRCPVDYSMTHLDELFAALNHVFALCKQQVLSPAAAA